MKFWSIVPTEKKSETCNKTHKTFALPTTRIRMSTTYDVFMTIMRNWGIPGYFYKVVAYLTGPVVARNNVNSSCRN